MLTYPEVVAGVRAVYFDIGETILDRTREYLAWAEWLRVPSHTFSAVFGAMIADGRSVRDVVAYFNPEVGFSEQRRAMSEAGRAPLISGADLYPDVRAAFRQLRELGMQVGVAGNQPGGIGSEVRALDLGADAVWTSAEWGVSKPSPEFFRRIIATAELPAAQIAYVADQIDKDVLPAMAEGMQAIRVLRGQWGRLVRNPAVEARCLGVVSALTEIPNLLSPH